MQTTLGMLPKDAAGKVDDLQLHSRTRLRRRHRVRSLAGARTRAGKELRGGGVGDRGRVGAEERPQRPERPSPSRMLRGAANGGPASAWDLARTYHTSCKTATVEAAGSAPPRSWSWPILAVFGATPKGGGGGYREARSASPSAQHSSRGAVRARRKTRGDLAARLELNPAAA
jgi:hypothetical protein